MRRNAGATTKTCSKCGEEKPLTEFYANKYKNKNGDDRLAYFSNCKPCARAEMRLEYVKNASAKLSMNKDWYYRNREKRLRETSQWQRDNPDKRKEYARRHNEKPEAKKKSRIYAKRWFASHPNAWRESYLRRKAKDPDRLLAYGHKYRAAKRSAGGIFSTEQWESLMSDCGHRCVCCKVHVDEMQALYPRRRKVLEKDHIIPIIKGGSNWIWNIQPLCPRCNNAKRKKAIDYRPYHVRMKYRDPEF